MKQHKREREHSRRTAKRRRHAARQTAGRYWLTPKASTRHCSHCSMLGCVAVRPADGKAACESCIERLGIHAHESASWRENGGKPYAPVTVRHVDPATMR